MKKKNAYRTGIFAETLCCVWLFFHGYRIVERRYKTSQGEIDIIAAKGRVLAIVEVKARPSKDAAISSILPRQQTRLARAANVFLAHNLNFQNHAVRFDAMLIAPLSFPTHIKNAWEGRG